MYEYNLSQDFGGFEFLLHDVRYNPKLKQNLLYINMFDTLGYETIFDAKFMVYTR
jgi:hypothetical protein